MPSLSVSMARWRSEEEEIAVTRCLVTGDLAELLSGRQLANGGGSVLRNPGLFFNQTFLFSWRAKQGKTHACETILHIRGKEYSRRNGGSGT